MRCYIPGGWNRHTSGCGNEGGHIWVNARNASFALSARFCGSVGHTSDAKDSAWHQVFWIELRAFLLPQDLENALAACVMEVFMAWAGCKGAVIVCQMHC